MFFSKKKKPSEPKRRPAEIAEQASAEPSFIGRNCMFEGHITCDGELHIDGTVRGTVQAGLCVVDEAGVIQGTLSGNIIHVRGRVLGPIQGSNVFIHAGAHVEGDVFNDTISIENGAYVYGSIRHNAVAQPAQSTNNIILDTLQPAESELKAKVQQSLKIISSRK